MINERLGELPIHDDNKLARGGINPNSPSFESIGSSFLNLLRDHVNLQSSEKILEIGCGTGRITKAISSFLQNGQLFAFDANKRYAEYCRDSVAGATIDFFDIKNDEYNQNGSVNGSEFVFPYDNNSFDVVVAVAVFNHLPLEDTLRYLEESSRVLKKKGRFFATFFLLNEHAVNFINRRERHPFKFDLRQDGIWHEHIDRPLWNTAISEVLVRRCLLKNHLLIREPISYGQWRGSPVAITGHDVVIAIKQK